MRHESFCDLSDSRSIDPREEGGLDEAHCLNPETIKGMSYRLRGWLRSLAAIRDNRGLTVVCLSFPKEFP